MKAIRILRVLVALMLCNGMQASEYFRGYDVNQPQVRKPLTQRALEYERASNANLKAHATGFYNRLKGALGFQSAPQPSLRVSEYEKAYAPVAAPITNQQRGYDLSKAYEAEARKNYRYAKQAYRAAEEAEKKAWDIKNKAWYAKSDAWAKRSSAYGKPTQYADQDRKYQAAIKAEAERDKEYSAARKISSGARGEYLKNRSAYQEIERSNVPKLSNQQFERLLREAEARADARTFYPWYR